MPSRQPDNSSHKQFSGGRSFNSDFSCPQNSGLQPLGLFWSGARGSDRAGSGRGRQFLDRQRHPQSGDRGGFHADCQLGSAQCESGIHGDLHGDADADRGLQHSDSVHVHDDRGAGHLHSQPGLRDTQRHKPCECPDQCRHPEKHHRARIIPNFAASIARTTSRVDVVAHGAGHGVLLADGTLRPACPLGESGGLLRGAHILRRLADGMCSWPADIEGGGRRNDHRQFGLDQPQHHGGVDRELAGARARASARAPLQNVVAEIRIASRSQDLAYA